MGTITTVNFRSDTLFAVERDDGVWVAIKPICDSLGIDWKGQRDRIARNHVLSKGRCVMPLPSVGGTQETVCLRLDLINGWLLGIDPDRVKPEAKDAVIAYQEECFAVLFRHFYGRGLDQRTAGLAEQPNGEPRSEEPTQVRRQLVTEARHTHSIQAARELWFKLGLPTTPAMYADPRQGEFFYYTAIRRDPPKDGGDGGDREAA
jgi:hypothetical protein